MRDLHFEVDSDRQCAGSCSAETHRVVRVVPEGRTAVALFRRRDMAEELCGEFNKSRGFVASAAELLATAA